MKKIIYSLVIMIAAGSLFTSCVENTEPQGIKDLRLAKADYLDALSNLRAADAEKVKAEAALVQAQAATEQAVAAYNQAIAKAKELANEAQKVQDEVAAAKAKADIESIIAAAEKAAVVAQQGLAEAQRNLEVALKKIEAEAIGLTGDEKAAVQNAIVYLEAAQELYNTALKNYNSAAKNLWQAEYDVAAGKDGFETAESYKDSIADREEKIAKAKKRIAEVEALKENPSKVKEVIDAIDAENHEIDEAILVNNNTKSLYEASVFVEAQCEYAARWSAFIADSVPAGTTYEFVEEDEDGNKVAVKYPLYGGRIDEYFKSLVESAFPVKKASDYGIKVDADAENILVGGVGVTEASLDTAQTIVAAIVSALNRDLVVVNDPQDSANAAEAVKAAKEADSIYVAHRDILEKGLKEFQPYKDSLKVLDSLVKDTVSFKTDSLAPAKDTAKKAQKKVDADIAAVKTALKDAAADYIKANKDFATVVNAIRPHQAGGNFTAKDSSDFIAAVKKLGEAQAAYFGEQDSLKLYTLVVKADQSVELKDYKVAFSALEAAGYVAVEEYAPGATVPTKATSLYGGWGYGAFAKSNIEEYKVKAHYIYPGQEPWGPDAFSRIIRIVIGNDAWAWDSNITEEQVAYIDVVDAWTKYDSSSNIAYKQVNDTLGFVANYAKGVKAPYDTYVADKAVADSLSEVAIAVQTKFDNIKAKVTGYEGLKNAQVELVNIYASFSGITQGQVPASDTAAINKGVKFNWTEATFEDPFTCVWVASDNTVYYSATAKAILGNISNNNIVTDPYTIFKKDNNLTEYAKKFQTAFAAYVAQNYTEAEEQLKNINEQFTAIVKDLAEYAEEVAEANVESEAALVRLCGVNADGNRLPGQPALSAALVADGEWNLGGYQKEWADELASEYPEIVKDVVVENAKLLQEKADNDTYKTALDQAYTAWAKLEDPTLGGAANVADIIVYFDYLIGLEEGKVNTAEAEIVGFKESLAKAEAGYSNGEAAVAGKKADLAEKERLLEEAEAVLKIAKAQYEEVIAKYGVN